MNNSNSKISSSNQLENFFDELNQDQIDTDSDEYHGGSANSNSDLSDSQIFDFDKDFDSSNSLYFEKSNLDISDGNDHHLITNKTTTNSTNQSQITKTPKPTLIEVHDILQKIDSINAAAQELSMDSETMLRNLYRFGGYEEFKKLSAEEVKRKFPNEYDRSLLKKKFRRNLMKSISFPEVVDSISKNDSLSSAASSIGLTPQNIKNYLEKKNGAVYLDIRILGNEALAVSNDIPMSALKKLNQFMRNSQETPLPLHEVVNLRQYLVDKYASEFFNRFEYEKNILTYEMMQNSTFNVNSVTPITVTKVSASITNAITPVSVTKFSESIKDDEIKKSYKKKIDPIKKNKPSDFTFEEVHYVILKYKFLNTISRKLNVDRYTLFRSLIIFGGLDYLRTISYEKAKEKWPVQYVQLIPPYIKTTPHTNKPPSKIIDAITKTTSSTLAKKILHIKSSDLNKHLKNLGGVYLDFKILGNEVLSLLNSSEKISIPLEALKKLNCQMNNHPEQPLHEVLKLQEKSAFRYAKEFFSRFQLGKDTLNYNLMQQPSFNINNVTLITENDFSLKKTQKNKPEEYTLRQIHEVILKYKFITTVARQLNLDRATLADRLKPFGGIEFLHKISHEQAKAKWPEQYDQKLPKKIRCKKTNNKISTNKLFWESIPADTLTTQTSSTVTTNVIPTDYSSEMNSINVSTQNSSNLTEQKQFPESIRIQSLESSETLGFPNPPNFPEPLNNNQCKVSNNKRPYSMFSTNQKDELKDFESNKRQYAERTQSSQERTP